MTSPGPRGRRPVGWVERADQRRPGSGTHVLRRRLSATPSGRRTASRTYWTDHAARRDRVGGRPRYLAGRGRPARRTGCTYFLVDDVDDAVATAQGAGGTTAQLPADTAFGRIAVLVDPHGRDVLRDVARRQGGGRGLTRHPAATGQAADIACEHGDVTSPSTRAPSRARASASSRSARSTAGIAPTSHPWPSTCPRRRSTGSGLRVEVAWLVHLRRAAPSPALRPLTDEEIASLHGGRRRLRRRGGRGAGGDRADHRCTTSRRSSTTSRGALAGTLARATSPSTSTSPPPARTSTTWRTRSWSRGAVREVWLPAASRAGRRPRRRWRPRSRTQPMLARTHGQAATPTTLGKELAVLARRLRRQLLRVDRRRVPGQGQRRDRDLRGARGGRTRRPTGSRVTRRSSRVWACAGTR